MTILQFMKRGFGFSPRVNILGGMLFAAAGLLLLTGLLSIRAGGAGSEPTRESSFNKKQTYQAKSTNFILGGGESSSREQAAQKPRIPIYPRTVSFAVIQGSRGASIRPCQAQGPFLEGVDCRDRPPGCGEPLWNARRPIPWQVFAQGEYVGPARSAHVLVYRLRVDDQLEFVYRLTRERTSKPYELNVGDTVKIESYTDEKIDRDIVIQPDGTITAPGLGQIRAAGRTVEELKANLEERYKKLYKVPAITVTPVKVNTKLEDLRAAVDSRFGSGGQSRRARVTPSGEIQLPGIGSMPAQGLTLKELKSEIDERYLQVVDGVEVTPVLIARAPRFVYVVGEVTTPGRFTLEGPTTVMQAISLAGGWNNGGNLREIVVFRRAEDWRLMATRLDMRGALLGKRPCPADEIWLRDSDVVVVPKSAILLADDFIELVFTRGIYGVLPLQGVSLNFSKASSL